MAQEYSFDVVSKVDFQQVDNAVNTAGREIATRFDFKGSVSRIDFDKKEGRLVLLADDDAKLRNVTDILQGRLVKQGVSLKSLDFQKTEPAEGGAVRQTARIQQGLPSEKAKDMIRVIKDAKLKVTASLQGDQLRISGRSKDDLQSVIALLRSRDFGVALQFVNYR